MLFFKRRPLLRKKHDKENELSDVSLNEYDETTNSNSNCSLNGNIILYTCGGVLLIILLLFIQTILINLSIEIPKDTSNNIKSDITSNISESDINNENDTIENIDEINDSRASYFKTISNISYFKKNSNQTLYSNVVSQNTQINDTEQSTENNENKEDTNKETSSTLVSKVPTSKDVTTLINYTEKLSIAALKIQSCGIDTKVNINDEKYKQLYTALNNKGIQMDNVSIYTLNKESYSEYSDSNYNLDQFLVITNPSSLFGDIVYVGDNGNGIKDDDGTLWFAKEIYK